MNGTLSDLLEILDPTGEKRRGEAKPASPASSLPAPSRAHDYDRIIKRARGWIAASPGSISGAGGHARAFAVAQALVNGFELSRGDALGLMCSDFNPKCEPPWSAGDLEHKIDEAIAKPCNHERGWLLNDPDFAPIVIDDFPRADSPSPAAIRPPVVVGQPDGESTADLNEEDDDPHRLSRVVRSGYRHRDVSTLKYWKGQFHEWDGLKYVTSEAKSFRPRINKAIRAEFVHQQQLRMKAFDPSSEDDEPRAKKVSSRLVTDVWQAMEGDCLIGEHLDAPSWLAGDDRPSPCDLVATKSGIVHLLDYARGSPTAIIESTPDYFSFNAVDYHVNRDCPPPVEWLKFLNTTWGDDLQSIALLQEWCGYLLTTDNRFQKMLLLVGPMRAGKGVIVSVIQQLVGRSNCCNPTLSMFGTQFGAAPLIGKTLAIFEDARLTPRADAGAIAERFLTISGNGPISIDRKHLDAWNGRLNTRFVVVTNELPRLADSSGALASRWCLLRFTQSFLGREDLGLQDRLHGEMTGIFNWAVEGLVRLRANGRFTVPESSADLMGDLSAAGSPVKEFVEERCHIAAGCQTEVQELYSEWKKWCETNGRLPGSSNRFGLELRAAIPSLSKFRTWVDGGRIAVYSGIRLKCEAEVVGPGHFTTIFENGLPIPS